MSPKGPLQFSILQKNGCSKTPKGPFTFFGTMGLTGDSKIISKKIRKFFPHAGTVEENTRHFELLLLLLSLKYGADLGRSRLVLLFSLILRPL